MTEPVSQPDVTELVWRVVLSDVSIGEREEAAVLAVLQSGWLSMGPVTEQFEAAFAEAVGASHAVAVTNGTAALHLAAAALGIGPGDEVICPALTFVASAAAMRQTGATVRFADSTSLDDFSLDPAEIDRLAGPATKAIVVLHYGGHPADMAAIRELAAERGLLVVQPSGSSSSSGSRSSTRHERGWSGDTASVSPGKLGSPCRRWAVEVVLPLIWRRSSLVPDRPRRAARASPLATDPDQRSLPGDPPFFVLPNWSRTASAGGGDLRPGAHTPAPPQARRRGGRRKSARL